MKSITINIDESVLIETEKLSAMVQKPLSQYINDAIRHYNSIQRDYIIERKLAIESNLVAVNSMEVLKEFEA